MSFLVQTCFICNKIPQHLCPTCQTNASRPARRARPSGGHVVRLLIDWPVTIDTALILTYDGSKCAESRKGVPFGVKMFNFNIWPLYTLKNVKFCHKIAISSPNNETWKSKYTVSQTTKPMYLKIWHNYDVRHFIFCWNQSLRSWSETRRKYERLKTGFRPSSG